VCKDGKHGAVMTTAGGSGQDETAAYLEQLLMRLGAQCVGKAACALLAPGAGRLVTAFLAG